MNGESTLILLLGGGLVVVQLAHGGHLSALGSELGNTPPDAGGEAALKSDPTGHRNLLLVLGQLAILAVLVIASETDPTAGRIILGFLGLLWLVFLMLSGWGRSAFDQVTQQIGVSQGAKP